MSGSAADALTGKTRKALDALSAVPWWLAAASVPLPLLWVSWGILSGERPWELVQGWTAWQVVVTRGHYWAVGAASAWGLLTVFRKNPRWWEITAISWTAFLFWDVRIWTKTWLHPALSAAGVYNLIWPGEPGRAAGVNPLTSWGVAAAVLAVILLASCLASRTRSMSRMFAGALLVHVLATNWLFHVTEINALRDRAVAEEWMTRRVADAGEASYRDFCAGSSRHCMIFRKDGTWDILPPPDGEDAFPRWKWVEMSSTRFGMDGGDDYSFRAKSNLWEGKNGEPMGIFVMAFGKKGGDAMVMAETRQATKLRTMAEERFERLAFAANGTWMFILAAVMFFHDGRRRGLRSSAK